jgi:capsule polysaccharide export protein KpsE/RkpR
MVETRRMNGRTSSADEIRLLDVFAVPMRHWRLVFACMVLFLALGVALALLRPRAYSARTVLVPASDASSSRASMMLGDVPLDLSRLMGGGAQRAQNIVGVVLESRTLADSIIGRLADGEPVTEEREAEIRYLLANRTVILKGEGGSTVVDVRGRDPELVYRIADLFPEVANLVMAHLSTQAALRRQDFLEGQLVRAHDRLQDSEQRLMHFQQTRQAPEVQEQARRTLEVAAQLQRQILEQEMKVAQMQRTATPSNPALQAAIAELQGMRSQLQRLTAGQSSGPQLFPSLYDSPELVVAAARLMRDFRRDEQVYMSLTSALAETQVEARNDLPVLTVLDPAELPEHPTGLPLSVIVGLAAVLGLFFGWGAAFAREYFAHARRDAENEAFFSAWDQFRIEVTDRLPGRGSRQRREVV